MEIQYIRESVRQSLLNVWDPIGVREFPEAFDEYDSYVEEITQLLIAGAGILDLYSHLWLIETDHMGLTGNPDHTLKYAEYLSGLVK